MIITTEDPFPGRCLNHRQGMRCLDYDDHDGRCTFEERRHDTLTVQTWVYAKPKKWVSPLEEA